MAGSAFGEGHTLAENVSSCAFHWSVYQASCDESDCSLCLERGVEMEHEYHAHYVKIFDVLDLHKLNTIRHTSYL